jgi:hypothetical protein
MLRIALKMIFSVIYMIFYVTMVGNFSVDTSCKLVRNTVMNDR